MFNYVPCFQDLIPIELYEVYIFAVMEDSCGEEVFSDALEGEVRTLTNAKLMSISKFMFRFLSTRMGDWKLLI